MIVAQKSIFNYLQTNYEVRKFKDYLDLPYEVQHDVRDDIIRQLFISDDPQEIWSELGGRYNISFAFNSEEIESLKYKKRDKESLLSSFAIYSQNSCILIEPIQFDASCDLIIEMPSHSMVETLFRYKPLIANSMGFIIPDQLRYKYDDYDYDPFSAWSTTEEEEEDISLMKSQGIQIPYFFDPDTDMKIDDIPLARSMGILEAKGFVRLKLSNNRLLDQLITMSRTGDKLKPVGVARFSKPWKHDISLQSCVDYRLEYETEYYRFQSAFNDLFKNISHIESNNSLLLTLERLEHEIQELRLKYENYKRDRNKRGGVILSGVLTTLGVLLIAPEGMQKDLINLLGGLSAYKGIEFISSSEMPDTIVSSPYWFPWYVRYK